MKIPPSSFPQPSSDGPNERLRRDRLWGALGASCLVALLTGTVTLKLESALVAGLATIPACWGNHWWQERRRHYHQCYRYSQLVYDIQALELRLLELEHYEEQINQAIAVADTFSQRISDENQKLKTEHFQLSRQIAALQNKRQELGQRFAELQPQKEQLEAELQELCQQIEITGNHKQEIEKNLIESTYNLKIIENTCYFIREELEQLHQEVLDRVQYREELSQSITSLEQQSEKTTQQLQSMLRQEGQLQTMLTQLDTQRERLELTCGELTENISTLQREEKILSESITEKREEVQSMENCLTYLRREYDNLPSAALPLPFYRTVPPV